MRSLAALQYSDSIRSFGVAPPQLGEVRLVVPLQRCYPLVAGKKVAGTVYRTMRGSAADLWRLCADGRQDDSRYFASQEAKAAIKSRFRLP